MSGSWHWQLLLTSCHFWCFRVGCLVLVMRHPKMIEMFTVFCSVMARIKKKLKSWAFFGHKIICLKGILLSLVHVVPECWQRYSEINNKWQWDKLRWSSTFYCDLPSLTHSYTLILITQYVALLPVRSSSPKNQRKFW